MKFNGLIIPICMTFIVFISSCDEIITTDISQDTLNILAPAPNKIINQNEVTLWWDEVTGATHYSVQIVKPNFNSITLLLLDSVVTNDKLIITLDSGTYAWRIRAENNGYVTEYTESTFSVLSSSSAATDISEDTIFLIAPGDDVTLQQSSVTFSWDAVEGAEEYQIQVAKPSFNQLEELMIDSIMTTTQISTTLENGKYEWKVRGKNEAYETAYTQSQFTVDFD